MFYKKDLDVAEKRHLYGDSDFSTMEQKRSQKYYDFLWIWDDENNRLYYGGWQKWYRSNTHADYGCVPQSVANLIGMLALHNEVFCKKAGLHVYGKYNTILKYDFVQLMNQMYHYVGTREIPICNKLYDRREREKQYWFRYKPSFGNDYIGAAVGIIRYAIHLRVRINVHIKLCRNIDYTNALKFIRKGLKESGSVMLMTTHNHHNLFQYKSDYRVAGPFEERKCGMTGHAVTITGIRKNETTGRLELVISTWGMASVIEYNSIYQSWQTVKAYKSAMLYVNLPK